MERLGKKKGESIWVSIIGSRLEREKQKNKNTSQKKKHKAENFAPPPIPQVVSTIPRIPPSSLDKNFRARRGGTSNRSVHVFFFFTPTSSKSSTSPLPPCLVVPRLSHKNKPSPARARHDRSLFLSLCSDATRMFDPGPSPAGLATGEEGDDDVKDTDDAVDDGGQDAADAVDDGHEAGPDGLEDLSNLERGEESGLEVY